MSTMREHVDLPDEDRQRLVHPLDQTEAGKLYRMSLLLREAGSPQLFFLLAALLWSVSNNYVTPVVVPLTLAVGAVLAARKLERDAWSFIPRRRQDLARPLPDGWVITAAAFRAAALFGGLLIICLRFRGGALPDGVAAWSVGAGTGVALLMALELLWQLRTARRSGEPGRRYWPQAFSLAAVVGGLVLAAAVLRTEGTTWHPADLLAGAAVMVGVQVLWWITQALPRRKEKEP